MRATYEQEASVNHLHDVIKWDTSKHTIIANLSGVLKTSSETQGLLVAMTDVISSGESLLQELKSPWELIPTEPVPEVVEFRPADWAEKYFSAQSAMRSSRVTLSPPYTK